MNIVEGCGIVVAGRVLKVSVRDGGSVIEFRDTPEPTLASLEWVDLHWLEFHEKLPRELRQVLPWGQDVHKDWRGAYVFDNNIQCPFCCEEDEEHCEYPRVQHDGDTALTECGNCGKTFRVVLSVTYEYASEPLERKEH